MVLFCSNVKWFKEESSNKQTHKQTNGCYQNLLHHRFAVDNKKPYSWLSKAQKYFCYSFTLNLFPIISDDRGPLLRHYYLSWSHEAGYMKTTQGYLRPLTTSLNTTFALRGKAFSEINVFTVWCMYVSRFLCRVIMIWCDQTYCNWHKTSINPSAKCHEHISFITSLVKLSW